MGAEEGKARGQSPRLPGSKNRCQTARLGFGVGEEAVGDVLVPQPS